MHVQLKNPSKFYKELIPLPFSTHFYGRRRLRRNDAKMIDDQDLGFFANFLGIFIFILVIAYHYVMADPKYEGN
ncbi:dolichyl-diphosphooligosaccharide--protein glycosyltransferase subunit 4A isoform X1 [Typha latifolia]|uniref:dolichyl-diphosphooligosaccharide--protein glycosyltransferase subunit 4A isoform X1 n=1 Tax=Typha latifolia TaxID=4733 RepID=UPI003C2EC1E2